MKADLSRLQGQTVTCAVSGGGDSVALLHLLCAVRQQLGITLYAAHFNHGLRPTADRDEAFVRDLCRLWQVELFTGRGDVEGFAGQNGQSLEEAARHLRYEFLLRQPGLIATAHHADDQVETVLLNLLRGTGLKGLGGMRSCQGRIVRPLLGVPKARVEAYLHEHGLSFCCDETNLENDALRNRIRHFVVPLLEEENPNLTETVRRMTLLLQQDEDLLQEETEALLHRAARDGGYDCGILQASPLCQRAVRQLLQIPDPSFSHVQAVCRLMEDGRGSKSIDLPHMTVRREYDLIYFGVQMPETDLQPVQVSTLQAGSLLWGSWKISWQAGHGIFTVRPRQTGDSIRLPGGTKTVKKLLIDRKIPAQKRDTLPVVVQDDTVIAVGSAACTAQWINIEERNYEDQ